MSERLYRWALRLYPRTFRERYADEMTRVLLERLRHERAVRVWMDVICDLAVSIPRQHLHPQLSRPPQWQDSMPSVVPALVTSFVLGIAVSVRIFLLFVKNPLLALFLDGAIVVLFALVIWRKTIIRRAKAGLRIEATAGALTVLQNDMALQTLRREDVSGAEQLMLGLRIRSSGAGELFVPRGMTGYDAARQNVAGWVRIAETATLRSPADSPFGLVRFYAIAILFPMFFTPLTTLPIAALFLFSAVITLRRPELSLSRKLLYLGGCVVLLRGWWWY
jgi:hypothetical protein